MPLASLLMPGNSLVLGGRGPGTLALVPLVLTVGADPKVLLLAVQSVVIAVVNLKGSVSNFEDKSV